MDLCWSVCLQTFKLACSVPLIMLPEHEVLKVITLYPASMALPCAVCGKVVHFLIPFYRTHFSSNLNEIWLSCLSRQYLDYD